MPTFEKHIAAGSDDCYTNPTEINLYGLYVFIDSIAGQRHGYFRFTNVTIPKGATIDHAYINVKCEAAEETHAHLRIEGIDEDNTATFSTREDAEGRPVTTANKDWSAGQWTPGSWYGYTNDPQDIKDVIAEIINRDGWASGNALAIKISNTVLTMNRACFSYEYGPGASALLHVEYSLGVKRSFGAIIG